MSSLSAGSTLRVPSGDKSIEVDIEQFRTSRGITKKETLELRLTEHVRSQLEEPFRCHIHVTSIDPLMYAITVFQHNPSSAEVVDKKIVVTEHDEPSKADWIRSMEEEEFSGS